MTIDNLSFREAGPGDARRLIPFIKSYYRFDRIPSSSPRMKSALDLLLCDRSRGRVWIIRCARDIGYAVLTFGYDLEFGGPQATLTEFYLVPAYRRRGVGTQAIHFIENQCRELGIGALELQVERDNVEAQAFYRRLRFKAHDRIPMSKRLTP